MATRCSQYRTVAPALVEHRAVERHRVHFTSTEVQERGGRASSAMLYDLSVYGCRLACRTRHLEGTRLWLRFRDREPVAAAVVWNDGQHIGCRFDAPIERKLVRELTLVIR
jgi:hypothetical protein